MKRIKAITKVVLWAIWGKDAIAGVGIERCDRVGVQVFVWVGASRLILMNYSPACDKSKLTKLSDNHKPASCNA